MSDLGPCDRGARCFLRGVGYDGDGSRSDGLVDEAIAVAGLAFHGDKDRARTHAPGIVFHACNRRVSALGEDFGAIQQLLEVHCSDYLPKRTVMRDPVAT